MEIKMANEVSVSTLTQVSETSDKDISIMEEFAKASTMNKEFYAVDEANLNVTSSKVRENHPYSLKIGFQFLIVAVFKI